MIKFAGLLAFFVLLTGCSKKELNYWERVDFNKNRQPVHVLSLSIRTNDMLVGTYGEGAFYSTDTGKTWRNFKTSPTGDSTGLSWNYIIGGDWLRDHIILATIGNGINISTNGGKTWKELGFNFFGVEHLYTVGAVIHDIHKYIPTADGIVAFDKDIDPARKYAKPPYRVIDEKQGLASQYIYDLHVDGKRLFVGSLHGFSFSNDGGNSWQNYSPNGKANSEGSALCKVRSVAINGKDWYAGCDDGLYISSNNGKSWQNITTGLQSEYVHDILIDKKGGLWVATYKGLAYSTDKGRTYQNYGKESGFYGENINCLAMTLDGRIYAGTNYGLYRQTDLHPAPNVYPQVKATFDKPEPPIHQGFLRPVSGDYNDEKDQTYLYGSTMNGNFRQHQGCEYNNPEGVPLRAIDNGIVAYVNPEIGHLVIRCDTRFQNNYVYAHYHHQRDITATVGQKVNRGDIVGHVGKLGDVTNEHLHFEISLSPESDSNIPNKTVNNELWTEPLPNCGTIVGRVEDLTGKPISKMKVYGVEKPVPTETPFSYAETYSDSVNADPIYNENFVIADVPAGEYLIWVDDGWQQYAVKAIVQARLVTQVKLLAGMK
jgi:murein DD-endopeptidase MepM/ murein hydrolase activator NlpD